MNNQHHINLEDVTALRAFLPDAPLEMLHAYITTAEDLLRAPSDRTVQRFLRSALELEPYSAPKQSTETADDQTDET